MADDPENPEGDPSRGDDSPRREAAESPSQFQTPTHSTTDEDAMRRTLERRLESRLGMGDDPRQLEEQGQGQEWEQGQEQEQEENLQAELAMLHTMNSERAVRLLRARGVITPRDDAAESTGRLEQEIQVLREMSNTAEERLLASLTTAQNDAVQANLLSDQLRRQLDVELEAQDRTRQELMAVQASHAATAREKTKQLTALSSSVQKLQQERDEALQLAEEAREQCRAKLEEEERAGEAELRDQLLLLQSTVDATRAALRVEQEALKEKEQEVRRLEQRSEVEKTAWTASLKASEEHRCLAEGSIEVLQDVLQGVGTVLAEEVAAHEADSEVASMLRDRIVSLEQTVAVEEHRVELERMMTTELMGVGQREISELRLQLSQVNSERASLSVALSAETSARAESEHKLALSQEAVQELMLQMGGPSPLELSEEESLTELGHQLSTVLQARADADLELELCKSHSKREQARLDVEVKQAKDLARSLEAEMEEVRATVCELQQQAAQDKATIEKSQAKLVGLQQENTQLREMVEEVGALHEKETTAAAHLKKELNKLIAEKATMLERLSELIETERQAKVKLETTIAENQAKLDSETAASNQLRTESRQKEFELRQSIFALEAKRCQLQATTRDEQTRRNQIEVAAAQEKAKLAARLAENSAELAHLRDELVKAAKCAEQANAEIRTLQCEIVELRAWQDESRARTLRIEIAHQELLQKDAVQMEELARLRAQEEESIEQREELDALWSGGGRHVGEMPDVEFGLREALGQDRQHVALQMKQAKQADAEVGALRAQLLEEMAAREMAEHRFGKKEAELRRKLKTGTPPESSVSQMPLTTRIRSAGGALQEGSLANADVEFLTAVLAPSDEAASTENHQEKEVLLAKDLSMAKAAQAQGELELLSALKRVKLLEAKAAEVEARLNHEHQDKLSQAEQRLNEELRVVKEASLSLQEALSTDLSRLAATHTAVECELRARLEVLQVELAKSQGDKQASVKKQEEAEQCFLRDRAVLQAEIERKKVALGAVETHVTQQASEIERLKHERIILQNTIKDQQEQEKSTAEIQQQVCRLQSRITEVEAELALSQKELEESTMQQESLRSELCTCVTELHDEQLRAQVLDKALQSARILQRETENELKHRAEKEAEVLAELATSQSSEAEVRALYVQLQQLHDETSEQHSSLRTTHAEQLEACRLHYQLTCEDLRQRDIEAQSKLRESEHQLHGALQREQQLEKRIAVMEGNSGAVANLRVQMQQKLEDLRTANSELKVSLVTQMEEAKSAYISESARLVTAVSQLGNIPQQRVDQVVCRAESDQVGFVISVLGDVEEELQHLRDSHQVQLKSAEERQKEALSQLSEAQQHLTALEAEHKDLTLHHRASLGENKSLRKELNLLADKLKEAKTSKDDAVLHLEAAHKLKMEANRAELTEMGSALARARQSLGSLQREQLNANSYPEVPTNSRVQLLDIELQSLRAELSAMTGKSDEVQAAFTSSQTRVEHLETQLQAAEQCVAALEMEKGQHVQELASLRAKSEEMVQLRAQAVATQDRVADFEDQLDASFEDLECEKARVAALEEELDLQDTELVSLREQVRELERAQASEASIKARVADLERELAFVSQQLASSSQQTESDQKKVIELEEELQELRPQLLALQEENSKLRQTQQLLVSTGNPTQAKLVSQLKVQVQTLQEKNDELERVNKAVPELEGKLSRVQKQLASQTHITHKEPTDKIARDMERLQTAVEGYEIDLCEKANEFRLSQAQKIELEVAKVATAAEKEKAALLSRLAMLQLRSSVSPEKQRPRLRPDEATSPVAVGARSAQVQRELDDRQRALAESASLMDARLHKLRTHFRDRSNKPRKGET